MSIISLAVSANQYHPPHGGEIDIAASSIAWVGEKVTGSHEGMISLKSGHLKFKDHKLVGGHIVMDMNSITCTDLKGGGAKKLVGHLNSADFFDVENFATAELNVTKVEAGAAANQNLITADLTIKGITKPISFEATTEEGMAIANISIDRTAYDIKYGSGTFFDNLGDKTISDEFKLSVKLVLK